MDKPDEKGPGLGREDDSAEAEQPFRVVDRRRSYDDDEGAEAGAEDELPTYLEGFRRRAEEAEARLHEYIAAYRKEREEMDALRKRLRAETRSRARQALGETLGRFLDIVDGLDRAVDHAGDDDPMRDGVVALRGMLVAVLEDLGMERIEPLGQPFDPEKSEAVMMRPCASDRAGQVVDVLRPGYQFDGKVVRAAQVAVGQAETGAES